MKQSIVTFFPVGEKNGGIILLRLNDAYNTTILVDSCIGDEPIASHCDVAQELIDRLPLDSEERPFVDAFILTHRHMDHLQGIQQYFYLGSVSDYPKPNDDEVPKAIIQELWSSHRVWKEASASYELCDDAKAFNNEMKRRVELFNESSVIQSEGDRAIIVGKDPGGKCDGLEPITYEIEDVFTRINTRDISSKLQGRILGPLYQQKDEVEEAFNDKNRQSIVIQMTIKEGEYDNKMLLAADAECLVWEILWNLYKSDTEKLEYDILQAPHHCSWHALSYDSQTRDENPKVCVGAKLALSQARIGACIVSQSKPIINNDSDPPSRAAMDEYLTIVDKERFYCTNEYPNIEKPEPLEFNMTSGGPQKKGIKEKSKLSVAALASTKESYPHG
ncbi:MAG: metallohydrolase [Planctomycetota bacterium]